MLELRPVCENCNKQLPAAAHDAMICSFECTFCAACVATVLQNVCPNCTGGFSPRPVRPKQHLAKNPASAVVTYKPTDELHQTELIKRYSNIPPEKR